MDHPWTLRIIAGGQISESEALELLDAQGARTSFHLAGAHALREHFLGNRVNLCSIINAKSGICAENCSFCAQSSHHRTTAPVFPLKDEDEIVGEAVAAQQRGSHCFGIVTSGTRIRPGAEFDRVLAAVGRIRRETDIEPSASLGILDRSAALALAQAGCVTYHHNLETARSFFPEVCTTHDYEEDVETVRVAKSAGMKVCCGGIFGLGESAAQRVELAATLRDLEVDSVPLNFLNPVPGTPLEDLRALTPFDCLRTIAMFRFMLPERHISVCGGRETNLREFQSWIFMAGASGAMVGNYLTTQGRDLDQDLQMLRDAEVEINVCG